MHEVGIQQVNGGDGQSGTYDDRGISEVGKQLVHEVGIQQVNGGDGQNDMMVVTSLKLESSWCMKLGFNRSTEKTVRVVWWS